MSVADKVLGFLEENKGQYVSGGELALGLGVSRNAVWKAVNALKAKGYEIGAVTNKGYILYEENRLLSAQSIAKYIANDAIRIEYRDKVTSTNTVLKEMAEGGESEGLLLVAAEQTAGKGRRGRSFLSPNGTGAYFSLLLKPRLKPTDSLLITTCAAVAVARAVEKHAGGKTAIKWVNDVYRNGKKICGILTEASFDMEGGGLAWAVLGIGINMYFPDGSLPDELKEKVGAVFDTDAFTADDMSKIVADTVNGFMEEYAHLTDKRFLADYRSRSYLDGKSIFVIKGEKQYAATAVGIDDDFRLLVRYPDGATEWLSSGEVSTSLVP